MSLVEERTPATLPPPVLPAPAPGPRPPSRGRRVHPGWIAAGIGLAAIGVGVLGEQLDWWDEVPWVAVLAAWLVLIGVALVVSAALGLRTGGLVAVGIPVAVIVALGSVIDVPLRGGVGDREYRPVTLGQLTDQHLLAGKLTVDLRDLPVLGDTRTTATVTMGQLVVLVPVGTPVRLVLHAGFGDLQVLVAQPERGVVSGERSGVSSEWTLDLGGWASASDRLTVEASVGFGQVRVGDV